MSNDRAPAYVGGLDLGRPHEFTALAVLERTEVSSPDDARRFLRHYAVRHLERLPPATPYPEVFARVTEVFAAPPLRGSRSMTKRMTWASVGMSRSRRVSSRSMP